MIQIPELIKKIKENHTFRLCHLYYTKFQVRVLKRGTLRDNILIKYLFKDLFLYFLVSFFFFFMIFFVNQILLTVEDLLAKSAPFADVMRIMFYSLPFIIAQSAPFATLAVMKFLFSGLQVFLF